MTSQTHQAEDKRKPSLQRKPAKPVRPGPVAPAPQPSPHALQETIADPSHASPADILALQRTAGNRAVTHLIQAKLTVGPAGDKYEQEADRVAEQVVSGQPAVQRQAEEEEEVQTKPLAASITPLVQRQAEDEEEVQTKSLVQRQAEEEEEVQAKPLTASITPLVQRQAEDEEEVQTKSLVQRQAEEEEEVQAKPLAASITPLVQRQAEDEEEIQTFPSPTGRGDRGEGEVQRQVEDEEEVQTKSNLPWPAWRSQGGQSPISNPFAGFEASPDVESRLAANKGGGSPLPGEVRAAMEPRFGADFSSVRIHTGGEADDLNRQLSAQAFTHGRDIYMAAGKYAPGTPGGNRLLAHELTHTIQQTGGVARLQRVPAKVLDTAHLHSFTERSGVFHVTAGTFKRGRIGDKLNKGDTVDVASPLTRDVTNRWLRANKDGTTGFIRQEKIEYLPTTAPTVNMANVPLTGGDLRNARQMVYNAAIQVLGEAQGGDTETRHAVAALIGAFRTERDQATTIPDTESLLSRLAAGDKEPLKVIFSKELPGQLATRIAAVTGQEEEAVEEDLEAKVASLINNSLRWRPFAQAIGIGGQTYTSKFTPINQAFDPTFAGRGQAGYASMTAHLPVPRGEDVPEYRGQVTNAWYTQFRKGNTVDGDLLFEAFRSGAFSEKGVKDPTARQTLARTKARDLLKAMVVQYVKSREPGERNAILAGTVPEITVISTGLLTSFLGKLDATILREHAEAFESFHGQTVPFAINLGGANVNVSVRFNIINFNKAVNEFRLLGASRSSQQLEMNARAIGRLRTFKEQGLTTLEQKFNANQAKIDGLAPLLHGETLQSLRTQNQKLQVQIVKVRQLWARIESVTARWGRLKSGSGSRYELPALVSNLGYQLGATVHYNCMSGKDRTGMADVEAKLLAFQMDQRVNEAIANGIPLERAKVVPPYEGEFRELDAEAMAKLIFEGGNLNIQQINTGVAGYKIRGAMKGTVFAGRLDQLVATQRGQQALRQYLGVDDTISVKAKELSKMVNALSGFTGA